MAVGICIMNSFMICIDHEILLSLSSHGCCDGRGSWKLLGRREKVQEFLKRPEVNRSLGRCRCKCKCNYKIYFQIECVSAWIRLICLRLLTHCGLLCVLLLSLSFHKFRRLFWLDVKLSDFEEVLFPSS